MSTAVLTQALLVAMVSVLAAAGAATWWGSRVALGVLAGGFWNVVSLWCLGNLLTAWLGPKHSQRRAIGWLLLKFPLLYGLAFVALRSPVISLIGFGVGFTVSLAAMLAILAWTALVRPGRADG